MTPELRAAFVEQIRRDTETLTDPAHHVEDDPCGRQFYEDRIASFKAALLEDAGASDE